MADIVVENNNIGYAIFTAIIAVIIVVYIYLTSSKNEEEPSKVVNDDPKTERKDVGKSSKKKKSATDKRKDTKVQFSHPWLLNTLKGHGGNILDMDFSSNGKYLASCGEGGSIMVNEKHHQGKKKNIENNRYNSALSKKNDISTLTDDGFYLTKSQKVPFNIFRKLSYSEEELYRKMLMYVLSKDEQKSYGYPIECVNEPGKVIISNGHVPYTNDVTDPDHRICCRCHSSFVLQSDGSYFAEEDCIYHWGKKKKIKLGDCYKLVYSCCDGELKTEGCQRSRYHVSNQSVNDLNGFVKTRSKGKKNKNYGIYSIDCEMCFTVQGLEVTKVSVVRPDGLIVYDALVLPEYPVVDYNTNFSGITAKDLKDVRTTLEDVHAILLKLFNSKTILIGHGLENDLKSLKLLHETVIDTSIVFPHHFGLPYRRSLKSLINHYLHQTIQNGKGHDSAEDARACMELMLWKVLKDRQRQQKQQRS